MYTISNMHVPVENIIASTRRKIVSLVLMLY